jgi:hypothetical protein
MDLEHQSHLVVLSLVVPSVLDLRLTLVVLGILELLAVQFLVVLLCPEVLVDQVIP